MGTSDNVITIADGAVPMSPDWMLGAERRADVDFRPGLMSWLVVAGTGPWPQRRVAIRAPTWTRMGEENISSPRRRARGAERCQPGAFGGGRSHDNARSGISWQVFSAEQMRRAKFGADRDRFANKTNSHSNRASGPDVLCVFERDSRDTWSHNVTPSV